MRSIHIKASREYDVLVERGLLDRAGEYLSKVSAPGMAAVVSDETVFALYGERTVRALEKAGYRVYAFTFPAGEESKNLSTYASALHFLGEHRFSRSDVVVALGGGVVGDLAGFAAATYRVRALSHSRSKASSGPPSGCAARAPSRAAFSSAPAWNRLPRSSGRAAASALSSTLPPGKST